LVIVIVTCSSTTTYLYLYLYLYLYHYHYHHTSILQLLPPSAVALSSPLPSARLSPINISRGLKLAAT
jgi:hypothetical protein